MKYILILLSFSLLSSSFIPKNSWDILKKIDYDFVKNPSEDSIYTQPIFSEEVKKLNGQKLSFKGFLWQDMGKPMTLCKFSSEPACISAAPLGPECYIEIIPTKPIIYEMGKAYNVKGIFKIEENAQNRIYFKLKVLAIN